MLTHALDNLPHRSPFRFVSEVQSLIPKKRAAGCWRLSGDEAFFSGHFPGQPLVPGVLIVEALAQLSGIVAFGGAPNASPARLAQVNVKILAGVAPPAEIALESVLTKELAGLFMFDVRASSGTTACASGTLVLASTPPSGTQGNAP